MRLETFRGPDFATAFAIAHGVLGDDAILVWSRNIRIGAGNGIEVACTTGEELGQFRRRVTPGTPRLARGERRRDGRPFIVALIGPTGAGKTTTAAKLAVHPQAFGGVKVGLLSLDTYRAGAVEQLQSYTDVANLAFEIAYDSRDLEGALTRLSSCDVIIIDTPGRGPKAESAAWRTMLRRLDPDETHFVIPATTRLDLLTALRTDFAALGATHAIVTKVDEVPLDSVVAELSSQLAMPVRWITDGQDVPNDLRDAGPTLIGALGTVPATMSNTVAA
jgi:flagellar biosynthesis protein FlhF